MSSSIRELTFKNSCPIPITYHWSIYKSKAEQIFLEDEPSHYTVAPDVGQILENEEKGFKLFF
jgi:hypothetical protein